MWLFDFLKRKEEDGLKEIYLSRIPETGENRVSDPEKMPRNHSERNPGIFAANVGKMYPHARIATIGTNIHTYIRLEVLQMILDNYRNCGGRLIISEYALKQIREEERARGVKLKGLEQFLESAKK